MDLQFRISAYVNRPCERIGDPPQKLVSGRIHWFSLLAFAGCRWRRVPGQFVMMWRVKDQLDLEIPSADKVASAGL